VVGLSKANSQSPCLTRLTLIFDRWCGGGCLELDRCRFVQPGPLTLNCLFLDCWRGLGLPGTVQAPAYSSDTCVQYRHLHTAQTPAYSSGTHIAPPFDQNCCVTTTNRVPTPFLSFFFQECTCIAPSLHQTCCVTTTNRVPTPFLSFFFQECTYAECGSGAAKISA
jgi:hypothetical protein